MRKSGADCGGVPIKKDREAGLCPWDIKVFPYEALRVFSG